MFIYTKDKLIPEEKHFLPQRVADSLMLDHLIQCLFTLTLIVLRPFKI